MHLERTWHAMYIQRMQRMVRKQLYLSAEQNARLRRAAGRLRRTEADLVREAIDRHLGEPATVLAHVDEDPIWDIVGIGAGADRDVSERADDFLYGPKRR
jgi:hypothetical protein